MNVWTFDGNLGQDCRKGSAGSNAVVNFSVGAKSGFGDKQETIWVDCALWGKAAESKLSDYLLKGQYVVVSGEMGTRTHDGKTYITCKVNNVGLGGGGKKEGGSSSAPQQQARPQQSAQDEFEDQIPF